MLRGSTACFPVSTGVPFDQQGRRSLTVTGMKFGPQPGGRLEEVCTARGTGAGPQAGPEWEEEEPTAGAAPAGGPLGS